MPTLTLTKEEAETLYPTIIRLAYKSVQSLRGCIGYYGLEREDFNQLVELGLWRALRTYDRTKSQLSTWVWTITRGVVQHEIRQHYSSICPTTDIYLDALIHHPRLTPEDIATVKEAIRIARQEVGDRNTTILIETLLIDRTLQEVGNEYGITRERARQIGQKTLQKLKAHYHPGKAKLIS